jgi:nitrous oxide reductase accessory protein NosL
VLLIVIPHFKYFPMKKNLFLFALLVMMVAGCKNRKEEIPVVPEQVNLQLTAYSNDYEVYAEAKPLQMP